MPSAPRNPEPVAQFPPQSTADSFARCSVDGPAKICGGGRIDKLEDNVSEPVAQFPPQSTADSFARCSVDGPAKICGGGRIDKLEDNVSEPVAQLAEHFPFKEGVESSILSRLTTS